MTGDEERLERARDLLADRPYDLDDYTVAINPRKRAYSSFYNRETGELETSETDAGDSDADLGDVLLNLVREEVHELDIPDDHIGRGQWARYTLGSLLDPDRDPENVDY